MFFICQIWVDFVFINVNVQHSNFVNFQHEISYSLYNNDFFTDSQKKLKQNLNFLSFKITQIISLIVFKHFQLVIVKILKLLISLAKE